MESTVEQSQRPPSRPRSKGWSFSSKTSHGRQERPDLPDSPSEKRDTIMAGTTKANPNAAMNEAQPSTAAMEHTTISFLSSVQHVDASGDPISEPDLTNPTRSRWERPLDTIRSFENQIDNSHKRRSTVSMAGGSASTTPGSHSPFVSHRNSYFAGADNGYNQGRYSQAGGYYGRQRDSYAPRDSFQARHSMAARGDYYGNPRRESYGPRENHDNYGPPPPRHRYARGTPSDTSLNRHAPNGMPVYPSNGHQQSRETINTGESSGSHSDPWANSTEPSSENSSLERFAAALRHENGDAPGPSNLGRISIPEDRPVDGRSSNPYGHLPPRKPTGGPAYYNAGKQTVNAALPPALPPSSNGTAIRTQQQALSATSGNAGPTPTSKLQRGNSGKRGSWFKRRFSRSEKS